MKESEGPSLTVYVQIRFQYKTYAHDYEELMEEVFPNDTVVDPAKLDAYLYENEELDVWYEMLKNEGREGVVKFSNTPFPD